MTNRSSITGIGYIVLSSVVFSMAATFANWAYDDGASVVGTMVARFSFASLITIAMRMALKREVPWPSRAMVVKLLAFGGIGYFLGALFYFTALESIDSSLAIVLFNCYPLFVVALNWALFKNKPTPAIALTLLLTLVGVAITAGQVGSGNMRAVVLCIGAALLYTTYALGSSHALQTTDVLTGTALVMTGGALSFWLYWIVGGAFITVEFPGTALGWLSILMLAIFSSIGGTAFFFAGLRRIGSSKSSIVSTSEPVMAIAAGVLFLGESLTLTRIIGAAFVITALVLLAIFERRLQPVTL